MSVVHFKCEFKSNELQSLALPIEIRKQNLALVAQSLSNQPVELEPGVYHVSARLPAGQELYNQVTISKDTPAMVTLTPDPEDSSTNESLEVQRFILGTPSGADDSNLESLGSEDVVAKLRVFSGNVLSGTVSQLNEHLSLQPLPSSSAGVAKFKCSPGEAKFIQLLQRNAMPINLALPISPASESIEHGGCYVIVTRIPGELLSVDVHLNENLLADLTLRYSQKGLLEQASYATTCEDLKAERLLAGKVRDPISAAIGAYTLLRVGNLDRLHDWTQNLKDWFQWLPDGIAIRVEHLARLGKHKEAMRMCIELPSRGLPIFTDGLSYVIDRLRLYLGLEEAIASTAEMEKAKITLQQLQRIGGYVNFQSPILKFTGIDPQNPDDKSLDEHTIDQYEGIDVVGYMG